MKQEEVIQAILYRLKTGCQWRELPMKQFFKPKYRWPSVYYHFQKWSKEGRIKELWRVLLKKHKCKLDGTHTSTKWGTSAVSCQGRKKCKTSRRGTPLSCSDPISGNHNDAYNLVEIVDQMLEDIQSSSIKTEWLFLNADAGFDTKEFSISCFKNDSIDKINKIKERDH